MSRRSSRRPSAPGAVRVAVLAGVLVAVLAALSPGALRAQQPGSAAERGAAVYETWCAHCHDRVPAGSVLEALPGVASLRLKYAGELSPYIKERPDLADFSVLAAFLRNGAGSMPPFRRTEITDDDIAAIAAYLQSTSAE